MVESFSFNTLKMTPHFFLVSDKGSAVNLTVLSLVHTLSVLLRLPLC
jgi:hypothetical protein